MVVKVSSLRRYQEDNDRSKEQKEKKVGGKSKVKEQKPNLVVWVAVERVDWIDQTEDGLTPWRKILI
jgi:hypothetical protein